MSSSTKKLTEIKVGMLTRIRTEVEALAKIQAVKAI
jgi:hypothetical protein